MPSQESGEDLAIDALPGKWRSFGTRSPSQGSGEVLALEALPGKWRSFGNRCPPRKVLALEALPVEFLAIEALPTECNRGSRRSASSRKPSWTQNHRCNRI